MATTPDGFFDPEVQSSAVTIEPPEDFRRLLEQVRQGSEDAAWELIEIYAPHIFSAVRRKLNIKLRSKFDSDDFVQAVWASFFNSRIDVLRFREPDELICFLVGMAYHKVITEVRHRVFCKAHNVLIEEPLHDSTIPAPQAPQGHQPTPSQVAVARERWQRMVAGQPLAHQQVLALRYNGATYQQIAKKVGMHERTVRKIVDQALAYHR